jgi:hypothetical protein
VEILLGFFIVAGALVLWPVIRKRAKAKARQEQLARLLLVSGGAFKDRNEQLYAAAMKEIVNILRRERCKPADIERKIQRALAIAEIGSCPDIFEGADLLAKKMIQVCGKGPAAYS